MLEKQKLLAAWLKWSMLPLLKLKRPNSQRFSFCCCYCCCFISYQLVAKEINQFSYPSPLLPLFSSFRLVSMGEMWTKLSVTLWMLLSSKLKKASKSKIKRRFGGGGDGCSDGGDALCVIVLIFLPPQNNNNNKG